MDAKSLFEILVRENADMLLAYLRAALPQGGAVDDLFQETMLTAWRRLDDYDKTRPFAPWLRGIARNLLLAHHRQTQKTGLPLEPELLEFLSHRFDQWHQLKGDTFQEKLEALQTCLDRLPDHYRQPIDSRYRDNLGLAEIADQLSLAAEALKKRLHRARQRLLECIQQQLPNLKASS